MGVFLCGEALNFLRKGLALVIHFLVTALAVEAVANNRQRRVRTRSKVLVSWSWRRACSTRAASVCSVRAAEADEEAGPRDGTGVPTAPRFDGVRTDGWERWFCMVGVVISESGRECVWGERRDSKRRRWQI